MFKNEIIKDGKGLIKARGTQFRLKKNGIHEYRLFKASTDSALNENFNEATRNGTLAEHFDVVDLHSHTNLTDGVISPEELVENAMMNGITVLAVTDHNCTKSAQKAKEYAEQKYPGRIKIILGVELATDSGHLLVYLSDEKAMFKLEEAFPFIKYVNEHTDEMKRDYRAYYRDLMKNAPSADSLEVTLKKIEAIKKSLDSDSDNQSFVKTSMAHPFAGTNLLASIAKKRSLTSLGGVMAHPEWDQSLADSIDMVEVQNDFTPIGNKRAHKHFPAQNMSNLSTGSDSRVADPQTLTLIIKGTDPFQEIQAGRTIFIQRKKDKADRYFDRVVQWQAWLLDYYMSEVKRGTDNVMLRTSEISGPNRILDILQGIQTKVRKCLYDRAYKKWKKRHTERVENKH